MATSRSRCSLSHTQNFVFKEMVQGDKTSLLGVSSYRQGSGTFIFPEECIICRGQLESSSPPCLLGDGFSALVQRNQGLDRLDWIVFVVEAAPCIARMFFGTRPAPVRCQQHPSWSGQSQLSPAPRPHRMPPGIGLPELANKTQGTLLNLNFR